MKYIVTLNGKRYEVEVEKGQATAVYTGEAEVATPVKETKPAAPPAEEKKEVILTNPEDGVLSPMPGMIMQIKTMVGKNVKKGEVLFILEAMKMESEIEAHKDGVIHSIQVHKGENVEAGALLAVIR